MRTIALLLLGLLWGCQEAPRCEEPPKVETRAYVQELPVPLQGGGRCEEFWYSPEVIPAVTAVRGYGQRCRMLGCGLLFPYAVLTTLWCEPVVWVPGSSDSPPTEEVTR